MSHNADPTQDTNRIMVDELALALEKYMGTTKPFSVRPYADGIEILNNASVQVEYIQLVWQKEATESVAFMGKLVDCMTPRVRYAVGDKVRQRNELSRDPGLIVWMDGLNSYVVQYENKDILREESHTYNVYLTGEVIVKLEQDNR